MCGIFAVVNDENYQAIKTAFTGLKTLEYRGYDSWGIIAPSKNNQLFIKKEIGKLPENLSKKEEEIKSDIALGHTRWATHGGITKENAHPHYDCSKKIFVVHNGIIENFQEIKNKLIKKGHNFLSQTDSEVMAHLLEEEIKKLKKRDIEKIKQILPKLVLKIFKKTKGLNAFIFYLSELKILFAIKNSSPIVFGIKKLKNTNEFFLASDYGAIIEHTNKIYFLEDNELILIEPNSFKLYQINGQEKKLNFITVKQKSEKLTLKKYPHFMIKEIHEQPQIIDNIVNNQSKEIKKLAQIIKKSYGNYFIGCGSAFYAALCGTYLFSKVANRHTNASIGSEFSYLVNFLKPDSLVIALSQSGETIDIISSVNKAKEKKAKVVAITNGLGSTLYRLADHQILLNAGVEKAVVATKSFTAKLTQLILLSFALNNQLSLGQKLLIEGNKQLREILRNDDEIKKLARYLKNKQHIYILGRGLFYPIALEAALKIKEISYIHAEGFASGELKHGVIALIEKETPIIVFNPEDETYRDTLSSAYEVKARGGFVVGISSKNDPVYDVFFNIKNCDVANVIPYVSFAQLLSYYLTIEKKLDPDKPRNLAKSVTVK